MNIPQIMHNSAEWFTGAKAEVLAMKEKPEEADKKVTGWMVIPTACDQLTAAALTETAGEIQAADALPGGASVV